jgi:hypothetical protein
VNTILLNEHWLDQHEANTVTFDEQGVLRLDILEAASDYEKEVGSLMKIRREFSIR